MMFIAISLGLLANASAGPVGHEVNIESGLMSNEDPMWEMFQGYGALLTTGVSGGIHVAPQTTVRVAWQHGATGGTLSLDGDDSVTDEYGDPLYIEGPYLGIVVDRYSVGAKYTWAATHWFQPYATGEGTLTVGHILLDDDRDKEGNPNEIRRGALAPGGLATLGAEFLPFGKNARWRIALFLETGYQATLPLKFVDRTQSKDIGIGDLRFQGVVSRMGLGARF